MKKHTRNLFYELDATSDPNNLIKHGALVESPCQISLNWFVFHKFSHIKNSIQAGCELENMDLYGEPLPKALRTLLVSGGMLDAGIVARDVRLEKDPTKKGVGGANLEQWISVTFSLGGLPGPEVKQIVGPWPLRCSNWGRLLGFAPPASCEPSTSSQVRQWLLMFLFSPFLRWAPKCWDLGASGPLWKPAHRMFHGVAPCRSTFAAIWGTGAASALGQWLQLCSAHRSICREKRTLKVF